MSYVAMGNRMHQVLFGGVRQHARIAELLRRPVAGELIDNRDDDVGLDWLYRVDITDEEEDMVR